MYAVIKIGPQQFRVSEGDIISAPLLGEAKDSEITLDHVLMYVKDSDQRVGQPYLSDVKVTAKVLDEKELGEKVVAFKYRKRKNSATKTGSRKKYTKLSIVKIAA